MSTTPTQVAAAYQAILRTSAPGGATGAYAESVSASIDQGALTFGNFESSLIGLDQTLYTSLSALVTIDAFYNATPSSATLTAAATAANPTGYFSGQQLHNLGYSDVNVWTIQGANWASDTTSNFYKLYSGLDGGTTNDYQQFVSQVYLREFGSLPTQDIISNLTSSTEIANLTALLSGNGYTATPLQVLGGIFGYLLYVGQSTNTGAYAAQANAFLATAATDEATKPGSSAPIYGPELIQQNLANQSVTATNQYLTTGPDNVTGTNIYGSLTPYSVNGVGPTLNSTDIITGSSGSTDNTLTISDDYGNAADAIPVGTTITNIQNIVLNTAGVAGNNAVFDTTAYASVNNVAITSSGLGIDNVRVSSGTALTVTNQNVNGLDFGTPNGVQTYGGSTVTVTTNTGLGSTTTIGSTSVANANPTGAVTVNSVASGVTVYGGSTVTVNQSGIGGSVTIGTDGYSVSAAEPTGAVTVNAPATSTTQVGTPVTVYGGTSATITSGGGFVQVGALAAGQTVFTVSGNDTIVDNAAAALTHNYLTGADSGIAFNPPAAGTQQIAVAVLGGQAVSVTTNAGGVTVGADANTAYNGSVLIPGLEPTGNVTVTDTSDLSATSGGKIPGTTPVSVYGGANVTVTDSGSAVTVGDYNGTNVVAPTGAVVVTDTAQVANDFIVNSDYHDVTVYGGTTVQVTTNAGDVYIGSSDGAAGAEPSGNVTVTDTSVFNDVKVYGGANVTVSATGDYVTIGNGNTATDPTGNVTVTESGLFTGGTQNYSGVTIEGGVVDTVTTTGGDVTIGEKGAPATGAVTITDTQVGANSDTFAVVGGTTVSITTTASSGDIWVGDTNSIGLDAAGTALANPTAYATGNVTIVDESLAGSNAAGSSNVYGTGAVFVRTNGATSVSVTGGSSASITDVQTTPATGGANAGKAIGPSTLTTVSLDGVSGAASITSDALANLTIADSSKTASTTVTIHEPASTTAVATSLALTLSNDAVGGTTSVTDAFATAVAVGTSGTAANEFSLIAPKATSLTFSNAAAVTLDAGNLTALTSITATGAGALTLPDVTVDGSLAKIDVSAATGAVTVANLDPTITSFKGGTGSDTVTINGNSVVNAISGNNDTIDAGSAATNTLIADYIANVADTPLGANASIRGFTTLGLGIQAQSLAFNDIYDASGFSALTVGAVAGPVVFGNVAANTSLTVTADPNNVVLYELNDTKGTSDSLALTVGVDGSSGTKGITVPEIILGDYNYKTNTPINGHGVVTLDLASVGQTGLTPAAVNTVTILDESANATATGSQLQHIVITGDTALDLTYLAGAGPSSVTSIDASGSTGAVNLVLGEVDLSAKGVSFTGGGGLLTAAGVQTTTAQDSYTTGSGGGTLTLGYGGAFNTAIGATGAYDKGSETVTLTKSAAVSDTLNVGAGVTVTNNGVTGGVTGFVSTVGSTADVLSLVSASLAPATPDAFSVLANVNTVTGVYAYGNTAAHAVTGWAALDPNQTLQNLAFTSSNGVLSFSAVGIHTLSEFNQTQLIVAAEAIVTAAADAVTNVAHQEQVVTFSTGGNTFIVASDAFANPANPIANQFYGASVVELNGVTGITGFGSTGAATVIDTSNVAEVSANNGGTAKGATYNDTGYSEDGLFFGTTGATNTYNNLGAAAQIDLAGGADLGNLVVTQIGASGSDSLTLNFQTGATLDSVTTNGDGVLAITANGVDVITSLVDASNTTTTIDVSQFHGVLGFSNLTIGGITDTALTTFDAHTDAGSLVLTASEGGLTILGALGGDTITASGAGDTITVGSATSAALTGAVAIVANGAADTITLVNEQPGAFNTIGAAASGDTISVDVGQNIIGGTIANGVATHALGSGDTVNLASGGANWVDDSVWVGAGSTVNLGTSKVAFGSSTNPGGDYAYVTVTGDTTGATAAHNPAITTITGAASLDSSNGELFLTFENTKGGNYENWAGGSAAVAQVNEASATSLANALDIAASQNLQINQSWFGGGNGTSVSNGQVQLASHNGLVDWFQFGGNTYLVESLNTGSTAAAHTALAATDVVVELTGLVNLANAASHIHYNFA